MYNYKTLVQKKKIKELNKLISIPRSWIGRLDTVKILIYCKLIYIFKQSQTKSLQAFL